MLQNILSQIREFFSGVFTGFTWLGRKFGWVKVGIGALILVILGWTAVHFISGSAPAEVATSQMRTVELRSVAELSSNTTPLSVAGTVSSKSQASVRAEIGGQITHIYSALGSHVSAGQIIAEVENASQRASVAQAQGAVDGASAGASVSQTTLAGAQQSAVAALLSAYGVTNKSIRSDIDPMFSNPEGTRPQFNVQSSNSQAKINAENGRSLLTPALAREAGKSSTLSSSDDLVAELKATQAELRVMRDFLDTVISVLNGGIATNGITEATIAGYSSTATGDRAAITGSLSALVGAQQAIETAQKSSSTGAGVTSASQAALTQAQAGLAAARAGLEKTIVRAPISGTVNSFSLKVGDYLPAGAVAVVIANNGALEVTAYITDTDAREVAVGSRVSIETQNGAVHGTITRIAPAIDPATKKIEVRIGITDGSANLLNGQSVTVSLERITPVKSSTAASSRITLPLSALKVGADSISVFTVEATTNKLVSNVVTIGTLLGDRVVIEKGVTADMKIVTDARGLQPGQQVIVK